ncbi:thioredoxin domain-containing protein [Aliidiomarina sp.]|uniref:thioredoxin family protein n=1 Tax=Aliidiomarina sp. TaxID=1872439 RepID=UPI003A4DB726
MKLLSSIAIVLASFLLLATGNASENTELAERKQEFTEAAFKQAQAENKAILIDVWAEWCPTCRRQQDRLNDYFVENPDSEIVVFVVDYDSQKEWVSYFKAPRQSTLILYHGEEQIWFSVAQTNKTPIFAALELGDSKVSGE